MLMNGQRVQASNKWHGGTHVFNGGRIETLIEGSKRAGDATWRPAMAYASDLRRLGLPL